MLDPGAQQFVQRSPVHPVILSPFVEGLTSLAGIRKRQKCAPSSFDARSGFAASARKPGKKG